MQEASASGVRDLDPDPDPPDSCPNLSPDLSLSLPRRPSFALELFDRFERVNSDDNTDDVIMTEIASDSPSFVSFVVEHSSSSNLIDESNEKINRKRSSESPSADTSADKKISTNVNVNCAPASSSSLPSKPSLPNRPVDLRIDVQVL